MQIDLHLHKTLRSGPRQFELDIQLQSQAKRIVIHGPSGAGKSATLKLIAGLLHPDRGYVKVAGQTWFDSAARINLRPPLREVGYLFQDYALFPHLTVRQNIAFGLTRRWTNPRPSIVDERVDYWLQAMGLMGLEHQRPVSLSGGQRQRTALARTLVTQPKLLLLDEPFAALDLDLRAQLRAELDQMQRQLDIPMVLITHDPEDMRAFGEAVYHMRDGHLTEALSALTP